MYLILNLNSIEHQWHLFMKKKLNENHVVSIIYLINYKYEIIIIRIISNIEAAIGEVEGKDVADMTEDAVVTHTCRRIL